MPEFSIIVPVYNRPMEISELLESLKQQSNKDFEVIVVDDGSDISCEDVVNSYQSSLLIKYFFKKNSGQGFTRNYGFSKAIGEYFIVFDSDCIIPPEYFEIVSGYLKKHKVDAFGGPDAAHPSFTSIQKAINQSMTSFFTTGGIRGRKKHVGTYYPRSFNMGMSRQVYEATKGYLISFMGEDLEFSIRIINKGFKTALIENAIVFHKRRTNVFRFFSQLKYFGRARINLTRFHSDQIRLIHLFPLFFAFGFILCLILAAFAYEIGLLGIAFYLIYFFVVFAEALFVTKSIKVALIVPLIASIQLTGYGYGLVYEWIRKLRGIDPNTKYTEIY